MQTLKEQIKEVLVNLSNPTIEQEFFHGEFDEEITKWDTDETTELKNKLNKENINAKLEEQFGGEGQGEDYWTVYSFTKNSENIMVKFNGWYQSYNGSEFTEWFFVQPKEIMVTQYFKEQE